MSSVANTWSLDTWYTCELLCVRLSFFYLALPIYVDVFGAGVSSQTLYPAAKRDTLRGVYLTLLLIIKMLIDTVVSWQGGNHL